MTEGHCLYTFAREVRTSGFTEVFVYFFQTSLVHMHKYELEVGLCGRCFFKSSAKLPVSCATDDPGYMPSVVIPLYLEHAREVYVGARWERSFGKVVLLWMFLHSAAREYSGSLGSLQTANSASS